MTALEAKEILFTNTPISIITDMRKCKDFWEFLGMRGNEYAQYRVYPTGKVVRVLYK